MMRNRLIVDPKAVALSTLSHQRFEKQQHSVSNELQRKKLLDGYKYGASYDLTQVWHLSPFSELARTNTHTSKQLNTFRVFIDAKRKEDAKQADCRSQSCCTFNFESSKVRERSHLVGYNLTQVWLKVSLAQSL